MNIEKYQTSVWRYVNCNELLVYDCYVWFLKDRGYLARSKIS